jgi:hypothetical protein
MGEAQRVVASSRGLVLTIASYVSWFAIPAGYVVYLFQKATTHPMSLRNPLARASEVAWQIRQTSRLSTFTTQKQTGRWPTLGATSMV